MIKLGKNKDLKKESLIGSLFKFIKKPDYFISESTDSFWGKLWDMFRLWSLCVVIAIPISYLIVISLGKFGYDQSQHAVVTLFRESPFFVLLFMVLIWAPTTEELTFRLGLRFSPYRLSLSAAFLFFVLLSILHTFNYKTIVILFDKIASYGPFASIGFFIIMILAISSILGRYLSKTKIERSLNIFYVKYFNYIFYTSTFIFALVHIFNFINIQIVWKLIPLLALPQLVIGFVLAYIRMKYSIAWSVFFHFLYNSLAAVPALLLMLIPEELISALSRGDTSVLNKLSGREEVVIYFLFVSPFIILTLVIVSLYSLIREMVKSTDKILF